MSTTPSSSDRISRLEVVRDALSSALNGCESMRDLPSLSREYRAVLEELQQLSPAGKVGDPIDEIARRRSARGAGTAKSGRKAAGQ